MGYLSCRAESSVVTCDSYRERKSQLKIQHFNYRDLENATGGFSSERLLGRGSHGCVYKGVLQGGKLVAIKRPSYGVRILRDDSAVENEIEILSKIQSPSLVNLVGFSKDSNERLLVVEFMSNGTLYDVLHRNPIPPNWGRRVRLALQTARALETLHCANPPIFHRDIKSSNILIDGNWNARLGDFGLALRGHIEDVRLKSTPPAGTIGYLDPGYVTPDNLSTKNDVFSFGILCLEIISGRNAIDVNHNPPSIVDWALPLIKKGKFGCLYDPRIGPPKDPNTRKQMAVIAAKCVRSCRERRPSMKEVVEVLRVLSKSIPLHAWKNISVNPCSTVEVEPKMILTTEGRRSTPRTHGLREEDAIDELGSSMKLPSSSSVRGSLRSNKKVSDVGWSFNATKMSRTDRSSRRHGSGSRNLMNLMAETKEHHWDSHAVVEEQALAIRVAKDPSVRVIGSKQGMMGRSKTLHLVDGLGCYNGDGILRLVKSPSVGDFGV